MGLPTMPAPSTVTSGGVDLKGAADLLSIISGKNTKTTTTNTGGQTGTQTNSGSSGSQSGSQSSSGSTSSSGSSSSATGQNSSTNTNTTGTNNATTSLDSIVSNSGSTNSTGTRGTGTTSQTTSGSTNKTLDSTNYNSGSTNTDSGYNTTNSGSTNTGSQAQTGTTTNNSRTFNSGRTDVSHTKSSISQDTLDSMLKTMLSSTTGLASVSSGQRAGGGYSGSTNTLLTNDLLARSAAAVAEATRDTTTTNSIGESYSDTTGTSTSNMAGSSVNNIGGSTSNVGPRTQQIGASSTTIGGTTSIIGGSTVSGTQNTASDVNAIIGGSTSKTSGTNTTIGTTGSTSNSGTSGTSTTSGTTNSTGTTNSSGNTSSNSTTGPSTTTTDTKNTGGTVTDTSIAGTGAEGLAAIIGLGVATPLITGAVSSLIGSGAAALKGLTSSPGSSSSSDVYVPGGKGTPNVVIPNADPAKDNRDVGEPVDPGVYTGPPNPNADVVGPTAPADSEDPDNPHGYADGGMINLLKGINSGKSILDYTNSLANGADMTARDLARGISIGGKLSGNSGISQLGQIANIATSDTPGIDAAMAVGNMATRGLLGQVMNIGNLVQNPNTRDIANLLTSLNPVGALINTIAGLTKLPTIGDFISRAFASDPATQEKAQQVDIATTPQVTELTPSQDTLQPVDTTTETKLSNIVSSIPPDEMVQVITDPTPKQESEYSLDNQGYDYTNKGDGVESFAGACVHVDSYLPSGAKAGWVKVGSVLHLCDPDTEEPDVGVVSYSQEKLAPGYRIITSSGASLVCSDTAPIPTRENGYKTPPKLLGQYVPVINYTTEETMVWEEVVETEKLGLILVQHITAGDKCFWAGEKPGVYILHHNMKAGESGGGGGGAFDDYTYDAYADGGTLIDGPKAAGPASGVADNVIIKATPGEYMIPVDVVEKIGVENLDAMVAQYHTPAAVQKLRKLGGR